MVIHDDSEIPVEVSIIKKPLFEQQSYVIVKNHVRELSNSEENNSQDNFHSGKQPGLSKNMPRKEVRKSDKKSKKKRSAATSSTESEENATKLCEISAADLEELKTVYQKCKTVMKKIESKYGHLLDLHGEGSSEKRSKHTDNDYESEESDCTCILNKKIVFHDDGREVTIDSSPSNHICPKKMRLEHSQNITTQSENKNIQIEYHSNVIELSDNLHELASILQNREIETTYRNSVIEKMRSLKQEHANEIKFNKHSLIEKLKSNPDELLDFKGTNLSTLNGYS